MGVEFSHKFMAIYVVVAQADQSPSLQQAIAEKFSANVLSLQPNRVWLVASPGTVQDVLRDLRIVVKEGVKNSEPAIVFEVASYNGLANPSIWAWIKTKWEATTRG